MTSHSDYYNSASLLRGLAREMKMRTEWFAATDKDDCGSKVGFAVFSRDQAFFESQGARARISAWPDNDDSRIVWTDQSSSLMSLMIWR